MRWQWRILSGLGTGLAAWLIWPAAALAGYCPQLVNCTGGGVTTAAACGVGAAMTAAMCLPGGEWKDNSDDFGGGDSAAGSSETPAPGGDNEVEASGDGDGGDPGGLT